MMQCIGYYNLGVVHAESSLKLPNWMCIIDQLLALGKERRGLVFDDDDKNCNQE